MTAIKMSVSWDVSEVFIACIIRTMMMEAAGTVQTPVTFYESTQFNISEDIHLRA
jgi:hypothetical protein